MLKAYIAGPMTGIPDFNHRSFNEAAERWREAGWEVVNPVELDDTTHKPRSYYMRQDIKALMDCDAIAMLSGWEQSAGASAEQAAALAVGIPVFSAEHPGKYVMHAFKEGYNACCDRPKYNHEDHWMDLS
jgi:nucleoside 2-deoxyribosyltransferase